MYIRLQYNIYRISCFSELGQVVKYATALEYTSYMEIRYWSMVFHLPFAPAA